MVPLLRHAPRAKRARGYSRTVVDSSVARAGGAAKFAGRSPRFFFVYHRAARRRLRRPHRQRAQGRRGRLFDYPLWLRRSQDATRAADGSCWRARRRRRGVAGGAAPRRRRCCSATAAAAAAARGSGGARQRRRQRATGRGTVRAADAQGGGAAELRWVHLGRISEGPKRPARARRRWPLTSSSGHRAADGQGLPPEEWCAPPPRARARAAGCAAAAVPAP